MAEKEKRRATTFVTSRGAIINVAAPSVYIAPGVTSVDVTNPTELREALREALREEIYERLGEYVTFEKYAGNPVFSVNPVAGAWDSNQVQRLKIVRAGGRYVGAYSAESTTAIGTFRIGIAYSDDLITWTRAAINPILSPGAGAAWDNGQVHAADLIYASNQRLFYLFYVGINAGGVTQLGCATSPDLITWTKSPLNPILVLGGVGTWDATFVSMASVVRWNGIWYLFYAGYNGTNVRIGVATSTNLTVWTKYANNPILDIGVAGDWDATHVHEPQVMVFNDRLFMFYTGQNATYNLFEIGLAYASTPYEWTKYRYNPVIKLSPPGEWGDSPCYGGGQVVVDGLLYKFFTNYLYGVTRAAIGYATCPVLALLRLTYPPRDPYTMQSAVPLTLDNTDYNSASIPVFTKDEFLLEYSITETGALVDGDRLIIKVEFSDDKATWYQYQNGPFGYLVEEESTTPCAKCVSGRCVAVYMRVKVTTDYTNVNPLANYFTITTKVTLRDVLAWH